MQDAVTQTYMQPFINLVQKNMALLTQFSMSPEVLSQAMSNAQTLLRQGQGSAFELAQSNAYGQLIQGMLNNYTEFMVELAQTSTAMLTQGQSAMMQRAQEASETVVEGTSTRGRRERQAG